MLFHMPFVMERSIKSKFCFYHHHWSCISRFIINRKNNQVDCQKCLRIETRKCGAPGCPITQYVFLPSDKKKITMDTFPDFTKKKKKTFNRAITSRCNLRSMSTDNIGFQLFQRLDNWNNNYFCVLIVDMCNN